MDTAPPEKPRPILLQLGTLAAGATERLPNRVPIPAGLSPLVVNVRVGDGGKVRITTWDPGSTVEQVRAGYVEITNDGPGPASYMIFAATPVMHRAVAAAARVFGLAAQLRGDFKIGTNREPTG